MKKIIAVLAAIAAFLMLTGIANGAKPVSTTNQMTTTEVTSASDGSKWLLFQADKISQPGSATWLVQWKNVDGSACTYTVNNGTYPYTYVGQTGTQTGATWGPTSYTFSYVQSGTTVIASLQLGEAYEFVVGNTYITDGLRGCDHGVLVSTQPGKPQKVLDDYVPLPWSVA